MSVVWVLVGLVTILGLYGIIAYNGLVRLRNRIDNAWSQIDVQLRRRHDLIPNVVETVRGYAAHEKTTLEGVIQARSAAISAEGVTEQGQAENMISGALRQLFALAESYPNLKANQNFLALQEELSGTEGRISYARQFYNDSVLSYNNKLQSLPTNVVAAIGSFPVRGYFETDEISRSPVRVQF